MPRYFPSPTHRQASRDERGVLRLAWLVLMVLVSIVVIAGFTEVEPEEPRLEASHLCARERAQEVLARRRERLAALAESGDSHGLENGTARAHALELKEGASEGTGASTGRESAAEASVRGSDERDGGW